MALPVGPNWTEFIPLDQLKRHLNYDADDSSDDVELELHRDAAQEAVEALIGPVLHRTVTEVHPGPATAIVLRYAPVVSVQSVTGYPSGAVVPYVLTGGAGVLRVQTYGAVTVTYTAGRTTLPASVQLAALIIAGHLWATQRGAAPAPLYNTGTEDLSPATTQLGYAIPNRAMDLLRPYLLEPAVG